MSDTIDIAAQNYEKAWAKMLDEIIEQYKTMRNRPTEEIFAALTDENFVAELNKRFGLDKAHSALMSEYAVVLGAMKPVAPLPDEFLNALVRLDNNYYMAVNQELGSRVQRQLVLSVLGDQTEAQFAASMSDVIKPYQADALVNDTLRKFSRNVEAQMAEERPDQLYIWQGPVDDRTSDECLDLIAASPMTKAEMDAMYPGAFRAGTHYNCRHNPEPFVIQEQTRFVERAQKEEVKRGNV